MSKWANWTDKEIKKLRELVLSEKYTYAEIAEKMKKSRNAIAVKSQKLGLSNKAYIKRITKHKHLRQPVMEYFVTHTPEETIKKFKITMSEFRSLMTVGYRDPDLTHLRKDTRRNDPWSFSETMFLIRHAGIQEREWIAKKLKRGTMHSVKEMLSRINTNSRYTHGLPFKSASELLGREVDYIQTKAGPISDKQSFRYKIVPWVVLYSKSKRIKDMPDHIRTCLKSMAKFQIFIMGTKTIKETIEQLEKIARKR